MSWWVILLIVWGSLATIVAAFGVWFVVQFAKGMRDAFG